MVVDGRFVFEKKTSLGLIWSQNDAEIVQVLWGQGVCEFCRQVMDAQSVRAHDWCRLACKFQETRGLVFL